MLARYRCAVAFVAVCATGSCFAAQRTFVASTGVDSNPCSLTAPCRTFTQALSSTATGGEIIVLDSAAYGPVTIAQSVSIVAPPGIYAGVTVFSGVGITISGASVVVSLRGLTVNSQGGSTGIQFAQGNVLHLERIHVSGFSGGIGIDVAADASITSVDEASVEGNTTGIRIGAPTTIARAYLDHVRANNNGSNGIQATNNSLITVRDSITMKNSNGIHADTQSSAAGASSIIEVENCLTMLNTNAGIRAITNGASTTSMVRVSGSTITGNTNNAIASFSPASIISRGNNTLIDNFAGESFDGTFAPQ